MRHHQSARGFATREGRSPVTRAVARIAILVSFVVVTLVAAPTAQARTVIDTTGSWDGKKALFTFGRPEAATYGQVVTVPAGDTVLDSFTFYMRQLPFSAGATMIFRGEVYAWDGSRATGSALWESSPRSLTFTSTFQEVTFLTGGVALAPGRQYVLFASVSKDYEQNTDPSAAEWGYAAQDIVSVDAYSGGGFVYLSDAGDESLWTTTPWGVLVDDLAFKASFSTALPSFRNQCKNGGWRRYGVFQNQGDCVSFVATDGRNQPANPPK